MFVAENKNREFDVVITSLVFDVVALTKQDFAKFLTNVAKLVRPGKKSNENLSLGVCKLLIIIYLKTNKAELEYIAILRVNNSTSNTQIHQYGHLPPRFQKLCFMGCPCPLVEPPWKAQLFYTPLNSPAQENSKFFIYLLKS